MKGVIGLAKLMLLQSFDGCSVFERSLCERLSKDHLPVALILNSWAARTMAKMEIEAISMVVLDGYMPINAPATDIATLSITVSFLRKYPDLPMLNSMTPKVDKARGTITLSGEKSWMFAGSLSSSRASPSFVAAKKYGTRKGGMLYLQASIIAVKAYTHLL